MLHEDLARILALASTTVCLGLASATIVLISSAKRLNNIKVPQQKVEPSFPSGETRAVVDQTSALAS